LGRKVIVVLTLGAAQPTKIAVGLTKKTRMSKKPRDLQDGLGGGERHGEGRNSKNIGGKNFSRTVELRRRSVKRRKERCKFSVERNGGLTRQGLGWKIRAEGRTRGPKEMGPMGTIIPSKGEKGAKLKKDNRGALLRNEKGYDGQGGICQEGRNGRSIKKGILQGGQKTGKKSKSSSVR